MDGRGPRGRRADPASGPWSGPRTRSSTEASRLASAWLAESSVNAPAGLPGIPGQRGKSGTGALFSVESADPAYVAAMRERLPGVPEDLLASAATCWQLVGGIADAEKWWDAGHQPARPARARLPRRRSEPRRPRPASRPVHRAGTPAAGQFRGLVRGPPPSPARDGVSLTVHGHANGRHPQRPPAGTVPRRTLPVRNRPAGRSFHCATQSYGRTRGTTRGEHPDHTGR